MESFQDVYKAKVTHLGATLKFSPRDIWELDRHCHGLIRKKLSLAKGTTPHWFSAPVALGGFGWLDIADRMYREFLLYYAASFNDNKADGELRQVKRTVHYMTLNAAGGRFAHLSLSDVTNPQWNSMYAAEKLAMVGEYFDLIPVTASTFERTLSRPLRPLPLIEPALSLHERSFVAGTDGAEEDGIASYAFTIAELDLSSHISYGDRIVGDQAVHRAELVAILMLLCYSFLASDVTIYVDRQAATDAIVKAEQEYVRNPNALHRTSEGGILTLIVSILALIRARGNDTRTFRHQKAHYYDEVDIDELKDALNPGPWLNRKADLKADKKLSNPSLDYDLYEGEIAGDDMFFVRRHDEVISTSLRRDFKHAAQYRHLELAYGDTQVDTSLPVPGADTTFEGIHESLEPFVHPVSHFAFTDPNLKNQSIWRAFFAFRYDLAFTDLSRAEHHSELTDPSCYLCGAETGDIDHYLARCPHSTCATARETCALELKDLCSELSLPWELELLAPERFLSRCRDRKSAGSLSNRGHISFDTFNDLYDFFYEEPDIFDTIAAKCSENADPYDFCARQICFRILAIIASWHGNIRNAVCSPIGSMFSGRMFEAT